MVQQLLSMKLVPQWTAAAGVILVLSQMGIMCAWTSPYLAKLTTPAGETFLLDMDEASWVASLLNVGRFIGAIIGALCVNFWGSKNALIHTLIPMTLSWALIAIAKSAEMLYVARIMGGTGLGMAFSCFPLYIGEIALPTIRGAIVTIAFCGSPFGNVLASAICPYLSMSISAIVFLIPCVADIALFLWLPNSPHHLMKIGDEEGARKAISWYRSGEQVDEEFKEVQRFVSSPDSLKDKLNEFKNPPIRMAFFIATMLFMYMQISGLNSLLFYQEIIIRKSKSELMNPSTSVILVSVSGAVTSILTINLMDRCGRKFLLIVSGLGLTLSMLMLGTHFELMDLGFDPRNFKWLPAASVFLFMVSFVFGLMPVPSAILSELFPANIKCVAACMASIAGALFAFIATKTYQPMVDLIGEAYVFYTYAALVITVVPFVLCFMPETKGKSLQEIQDLLTKKT
ncbi:facilitated trehalose transporter Tret1-like [Phymastichus coffea]|uniref:facilitated trehalose transporter Tret1-like n=1 Tax=Phymastichus coffea TaxID=108790 RepID=UPI00273B89B1|nr:facilitated trehalose transporter Tret1-like [Phymastichus coffea]